jgi:hypothetical protein
MQEDCTGLCLSNLVDAMDMHQSAIDDTTMGGTGSESLHKPRCASLASPFSRPDGRSFGACF